MTAFILFSTPYTPGPTYAQEPDYDQINEVAQHLNCPTCQGINLADCRTQTCTQWKNQIGDLLQEGYTQQEVLDYFVAQYGSQVLQEPPPSGSTLWLWILPFIILLAGAIWLFYTMRNWTRPATASVVDTSNSVSTQKTSPDDYLSQVEKDLE